MPEIVPGLYQLKVPIPNNRIAYVFSYLLDMGDGYTIIDPGWDAEESVQSLRDQLAELGLSFKDLKRVIVTHIHPDDYGMAGRIREECGAELVTHERELEFLRSRSRGTGSPFAAMEAWFRQHGFSAGDRAELDGAGAGPGMGGPRPAGPVMPDSTLAGGETLRFGRLELQVIWTPGHTPGHICFYEPNEQLLLTGDHILPRISPNVSLQPGSGDDPLGDYLTSMRKLRGMPTRKVLPAHQHVFDDLDARIDELEEHHEHRMGEMLDAIADGPGTAYQIAGNVTWATGKFTDFNLWTRRAAVGETLSHLRHLVNSGRARTWTEGELVKFAVA